MVDDNLTKNIEESIHIPMNIEEKKTVETQQILFSEEPSDPLHYKVTILKSNILFEFQKLHLKIQITTWPK